MTEARVQAAENLLQSRARRAWAAFAVIAVMVSAAILYAVTLYGGRSALLAIEAEGRTAASLKVALLRAVLERPRALPFLLSEDREVQEALQQGTPEQLASVNSKLQRIIAGTNAAVIYVVASNGVTVAASNWREPTSFIGNDYAFRKYFSGALAHGTAEDFAMGTVSKRPGLYISHRVGPAGAPLGVIVAKMEFDQLEEDWRETARPSSITDENNVVLITTIPSWRFMTTSPLDAVSSRVIRNSLQFGDAPLLPLPFRTVEELAPDATIVRAVVPGAGGASYLRIRLPVTPMKWNFDYLQPIEAPVAAARREAQLLATIILAALALFAGLLMRRRQVALMTIAAAQSAREDLEKRVKERTRDLSLARDRLQAEITDHHATEAKLQGVQQDLVQANRLAILGQVAAGVAHEINQPVATIRAYADNSKTFLERKQTQSAIENLDLIARLTERIGAITEDLKALARRGRSAPEPVAVNEAIEGAILLLRSRFTGRLDGLTVEPMPDDLKVMANRLRLEQVFINLLQNAFEAVEAGGAGKVRVSVEIEGEDVAVAVADDGPGISPEILKSMFSPFNSSKEKGLGLGLVISKDIVSDYGGRIAVDTGQEGSCFTVHLKRASA
jgi:two-component system C4-dicarboxylate transport sensor histidine kinase DctB